ncbi:MAG: glutamine-synthetase adenylyltransferase [Rhodobacteraceae bacterium]|nr:glutamine-synthetase adenylyltransferase [Paracoccaceae bacterium]
MAILLRQTRAPRPFNRDTGQAVLAQLPTLPTALAPLIVGTAGSSPYLAKLIVQEAHWLPAALQDPEGALDAEIAQTAIFMADEVSIGLRRVKRRVALLAALADLSGAWSLEQVTGTLTRLADAACAAAVRVGFQNAVQRKRLPDSGDDPDDPAAGGYVIMAMGKMGADELNYSSDIDLICLFDERRYPPERYSEMRQAFVRLTQGMNTLLSDRTADGYVFRTDLRLRPDPSVTPICIGMAAAERYYESVGRTWERAAFIKARPAAGDLATGDRFLKGLRPFIWRRHLDYAAIQDAHDIRLRIRDSNGTYGPVSVPGHDVKLGRGGIREIELFAQTRQLIAGGRDADLRVPGTVPALAMLAQKGWFSAQAAEALTDHYGRLREIEHRIQMVHDVQTHKVPGSSEGLARVACLMDMAPEAFQSELADRLNTVHRMAIDPSLTRRWHHYPAFRSARAQRIFQRFQPELMARLSRVAKPDEALVALDGFFAGLPAGVQLFSLFEANPQLFDLLIDVVGTSPVLAAYLARNAAVLDAVICGQFFAPWPGQAALQQDLRDVLAAEEDYERRLDAARVWTREWHFRIGVHYLRGLVPSVEAGTQYADLADAVIGALWPVVQAEFSRRHGPPPGCGAAILGMGSLGAQRLMAQSDLDVIVIYDGAAVDMSMGPRPLAVRAYYARLTKALITALTAPTAKGRLYEVDMRLRPSGNQGPVATSWPAFCCYQRDEAWLWEHLALTRARVIVGPDRLTRNITAFRKEILARPRDRDDVLTHVREMRARLRTAKVPGGLWDIKTGTGRMLDTELLAQTGALLGRQAVPSITAGLMDAATVGVVSTAEARDLCDSYTLFWSAQAALRLISGRAGATERPGGDAAAAFLCRATGIADIAGLETELETQYIQTDRIISAALDRS